MELLCSTMWSDRFPANTVLAVMSPIYTPSIKERAAADYDFAEALPFSTEQMEELLSKAADHKVTFLDWRDVMRSAVLLQQLTDLSHAAMLAHLKEADLRTDSEATVLLLLKAWYDSNRQSCSIEQLRELQAKVRYGRLTTAFISSVLPHIPDFCPTPEQANELRMSTMIDNCSQEMLECMGMSSVCPEGWLLGARENEFSTPVVLTLNISRPELMAHVAAVAGLKMGGGAPPVARSRRVYGLGYYWSLSLSSESSEKALALNVEVHSPTHGLQSVMVNCEVFFDLPSDMHGQESREDDEVGKYLLSSTVKATLIDVLGNAEVVLEGDSSLGPWERYMRRGKLCFGAEVSVPTA